MSSEIYENRDAGLIVPTYRTRELIFANNIEPIATYRQILTASDVLLEYLNIAVVGAAETIQVLIVADGIAATGATAQVANNRYAWFLSPEVGGTLVSQDTTVDGFELAKAGMAWPAHSMTVNVQQTTAALGVQVVSRVRYSQL